jgi:hypothetical protein
MNAGFHHSRAVRAVCFLHDLGFYGGGAMTTFKRATELADPRGHLEKLLKQKCPCGHKLSDCPLLEWRKINHVANMTGSLIDQLLAKHFLHMEGKR